MEKSPTSRVSWNGSRRNLGESVASPLGHAMVGMAAAAVASRVTDGAVSTPLWIGAFIASGVPDLDLGLEFVGLKGPKYHRNASHSLIVLAGLSAALLVLAPRVVPLETSVLIGWIAALLSHPVLDVVSTGPPLGHRGYGIALAWPLSQRRWFLLRPLFETVDLGACRSWREVWEGVRPELKVLGPLAGLVIALAVWL